MKLKIRLVILWGLRVPHFEVFTDMLKSGVLRVASSFSVVLLNWA